MDQLSDMIIQIKNGSETGKASVVFPYSKYKEAILTALQKAGFIKSITKKGKKVVKQIEVELIYTDGEPKIKGIERISKLSKRIYSGAKNVKPVKHGFGATILTTSKGILTDKEAKKMKIGGEPLFKIW